MGIPLFDLQLYWLISILLGIVVIFEILNQLMFLFHICMQKDDQNVNIQYLHNPVWSKCKHEMFTYFLFSFTVNMNFHSVSSISLHVRRSIPLHL